MTASLSTVIPGRAKREPGISRFRVWSFGPSRNDGGQPMILPALFFWLFAGVCVASAVMVVVVGAVAGLFLFVIMMLDVDFVELREGFSQYLPIGLVIGGIFLAELLLVGGGWVINPGVAKSITSAIPANVSNTEALGLVLYTKYIHYFQVAGIVLLVAMIGAIVLTLRHKVNVKRQDINVQNARTPELAMAGRKVASGQGLQEADAPEWVQ